MKEFKNKSGVVSSSVCKRVYGEMLGYVAFVYYNDTKGNSTTGERLDETFQPAQLDNVDYFYPFAP